MRNVSDKNCRANQHTHFVFDILSESRAVYDIYGKTREATDSNIVRRMHSGCWINKATNTNSEYVLLNVFTRQQWLLERASILR